MTTLSCKSRWLRLPPEKLHHYPHLLFEPAMRPSPEAVRLLAISGERNLSSTCKIPRRAISRARTNTSCVTLSSFSRLVVWRQRERKFQGSYDLIDRLNMFSPYQCGIDLVPPQQPYPYLLQIDLFVSQ